MYILYYKILMWEFLFWERASTWEEKSKGLFLTPKVKHRRNFKSYILLSDIRKLNYIHNQPKRWSREKALLQRSWNFHGKNMKYGKTLQSSSVFHDILYSIKLLITLLEILVQPLPEMRGFVYYAIIIHQNWTIFTYVSLELKETLSNLICKSLHFYEDIVYVINYY